MDSFFDTVAGWWPAGRADYHWHVLLPDTGGRGLVDPYRQLTHRQGLAPVPARWLHVTVMPVAPVDEISVGERDRIIAGVRTRCALIPAFELTLDRPGVGRHALECPGRPGAPLRRVRQAIVDAIRAVIGDRMPMLPAHYHPHTSIAYAVGTVRNGPVRVWLSDNGPGPFTFPVTTVSLVEQSHDGRHITWDKVLAVPLGAGTA